MSNGSPLGALLPFVIILGAFWLLILRPQRARMRQAQETQSRLAVGSEIITTAGLYGRVLRLDDDSVTLEVAPGVTNRYVRAAVGRVVTAAEGPDGPSGEPDRGPEYGSSGGSTGGSTGLDRPQRAGKPDDTGRPPAS